MKKILLDVDTGVDDALAILLATKAKELKIVGITTVRGNTNIEKTTANTLKILEFLDQRGIPVARGASSPLSGKGLNAEDYHGSDGLGEVLLPKPKIKPIPQKAVEFIIQRIKENPREITFIELAPPTNLALALKKRPEIKNLVQEVIMMGGAINVPGNMGKIAEFNVLSDPEAARVVLESGIPVTLVPLDVTDKVFFTKHEIKKFKESSNKEAQLLYLISRFWREKLYKPGKKFTLWDPLAVGVVIKPDIAKKQKGKIAVEVSNKKLLGKTYFIKGEGDTRVCLGIKTDLFISLFKKLALGQNERRQ